MRRGQRTFRSQNKEDRHTCWWRYFKKAKRPQGKTCVKLIKAEERMTARSFKRLVNTPMRSAVPYVMTFKFEKFIGQGRSPDHMKLRGEGGFVKQLSFKPRVKERGSYGWTEWWTKKEEEVMGEGIGESEIEELVPEWSWPRDDGN